MQNCTQTLATALILALSCTAPLSSLAEDQAAAEPRDGWREKVNEAGVSGSLRGSYWTSNKRLDDEKGVANAMLWMDINHKFNEASSMYASGHVGIEGVGEDNRDRNRLREAYVDLRLKQWDVRIGKQIIVWGRADRINPTDNLTPRDFTLLVPEEDDNRFGTIALRANAMLRGYTVQFVWLPEFRPYKYPIPVPAGVDIDRDIPNNAQQFGVKLEQTGKRVDWSVSFFNGIDLIPDWRFKASALPSVVALAEHHRIQVLGVDGATTAGPYGIRWELAYTRTKDRDGDDPTIKNPFFYGVVGVERTFMENLNINLQYYYRHVADFQDSSGIVNPIVRAIAEQSAISSNQSRRYEQGITARISRKWWNDTLEGEFALMYNFKPYGYFLRPKVIYAFNDHLKGTFGAEYFDGSDESFFGSLEDNRAVFAEVSYWF